VKASLRPVRVGVVGAGALGYHHIRLLKAIEGADLVGFYDHNPTRAPQVAKELETTAFPSVSMAFWRSSRANGLPPCAMIQACRSSSMRI
jgi:predicted homoserine dehydrogenase-like protein